MRQPFIVGFWAGATAGFLGVLTVMLVWFVVDRKIAMAVNQAEARAADMRVHPVTTPPGTGVKQAAPALSRPGEWHRPRPADEGY